MDQRAQPSDEELLHWLVLLRTPGIGPIRFRALLSHFGSARQILTASPRELAACRLPRKSISALHQPDTDAAKRDLDWLHHRENHHILPISCADYPPQLREIADPPPLLFVTGHPSLLSAAQIAVVGSRNPSQSGLNNATQFAKHLNQMGLGITSGLAIGVDTAAHQGALQAEKTTIAVLGSGLKQLYPKRNRHLALEISQHGALVSELPPDTPARAESFPRRNRIISGLSLGTLVVEATPQSGSLITARLAAEQGREVFAIPGSIHSPTSRGCHSLIRQGAKLVDCTDDILEELPPLATAGAAVVSPPQQQTLSFDIDDNSLKILNNMGQDPVAVDTLVEHSQLTPDEVSSILLSLELRGLVSTAPGGLYTRQDN